MNTSPLAFLFAPAPAATNVGAPLSFKPFKKGDWYGACDAQRFPDGSDPLVAGFTFLTDDGEECAGDVILDAEGLYARGYPCNDDDACQEAVNVQWPVAFAARAAVQLRNGMTVSQILAIPGAEDVG